MTSNGQPCPVDFALCKCHSQCFHHAPCRAEERKAARQAGGNTSKAKNAAKHERDKFAVPDGGVPAAPTNAAEARDYLAWLLNAGTTGAMGSQRARDMATVCKLFLDAVRVAGLEERIKGLEQALKGAGQ